MNRKSLRRVPVSPHRHYSASLLLIVFTVTSGIALQASAKLEAVKFVIPQGFQLEQSGTDKLSFMRSSSEPLGLFVTVLERPLDDKYLTDLSDNLVTLLRRGEDGYRWKIRETLKSRVSRYQMNRGTIKGLKGNTFVQIDYAVVRAQDKDVIVGSIAQFGREATASFLFEVEGREYSVRGWQALFQLLSSITGEKDQQK